MRCTLALLSVGYILYLHVTFSQLTSYNFDDLLLASSSLFFKLK